MTTNIFAAVKEAVPLITAAEFYGLEVHHGFARCPFHPDRTPSLKLDSRYHCFGCGADGDLIDLIAAKLGLPPLEAAKNIAADFGVRYDIHSTPKPSAALQGRKRTADVYREAEERTYWVLCRYYHLLRSWQREYAPAPGDREWHPLFAEALRKTDYITFLLDTLIQGDQEEKVALVRDCREQIATLERRFA